ncbi:putative sporulation protein YtxC [Clostridium sp. FP2]|uniref:putative sporulation protein YtxC n=1 Tax=Clostridium TaxID=1485 RepID=UPI0013E96DCB|nr:MULTISPECIES: putative sporulation protein YtxC [Clostridium]MBW9156585.1 putative sporulation protein YtxC [Clostridium tagluense]MBZ9624955.1 putative sporulation protein YtxC [Clostridium sp. FP2]WLC64756.1 putative sporulation protein YtxC [Clostridium tagluense]
MLLLTVVYNSSMECIIGEIKDITKCFEHKKMILGIAECIIEDTHFIKFFCGDDNLSDSSIKMFNLNIANMLYKIVIREFCKKEMNDFLTETYFFLGYDEMKQVKPRIQEALLNEGSIAGPTAVYCINRKNSIMDKITKCIEENKEINISGFLTFRTKALKTDLECMVDKVVEEYMVEKEYNEFIKLLKYFVDIQESKVAEINILIEKNGEYYLRDEQGNDLAGDMLMELPEVKFDSKENTEELIISTMITSAPKKVIIHCAHNCKNKELLQTISKVFVDKVYYCEECTACEKIKNGIKLL